ncbi:monovalent cation/H+ antiporter complex subunit F [Erythrobacter sp.]|uniref:monovalent cation/H+ antiporter complex subunit F n=1 Tax=Erythrobacter sp. TaxID=1042 RepID=UPI001B07CD93|nr:monovalent cation/H+ antiporter complex subunit F [Erythrobacter sp.]MBO6528290.1 hypothetical protein [Erythrobacter sp.]MBO6531364.1 hypothetical protein [Erythrobacter sp.]
MIGAIAFLCAALMLLAIGIGIIHATGRRRQADHMVALQLLGTGAAAALVLLSLALETPRLLDIALVIAALAAITALVFVSPVAKDAGQVPEDQS